MIASSAYLHEINSEGQTGFSHCAKFGQVPDPAIVCRHNFGSTEALLGWKLI